MLGLGAGAAAAVGLSGCGTLTPSDGSTHGSGSKGGGSGKPSHPARPIGDGSTSFTGKQPHQPAKPEPLEPGQTPPQFVIFSWDGAGEVGNGLFPRFLDLARQHQASMTFFLSGLYLLPESKKRLYNPPNNPRGASDIGYLTDEHVKATLTKEANGAKIETVDKETDDGKTIYEADVMINGKNYEIKVSADGTLLSKKLDQEDEGHEKAEAKKGEKEDDEKDEKK